MPHKIMLSDISQPLIFLRHGETVWNRQDRYQGRINTHLTASGIEQAKGHADTLNNAFQHGWVDRDRARIICSPFNRARETAGIVATTLGAPELSIEQDDRLREITMGRWEGLTNMEVKSAFHAERKSRKSDRWHFAPKGGESLADRVGGVRDALADLEAHSIVITHAGILRIILHLLGGMERQEAAGSAIAHQGGYRFSKDGLMAI